MIFISNKYTNSQDDISIDHPPYKKLLFGDNIDQLDFNTLVIILPILGDQDLAQDHHDKLLHLSMHENLIGKRIVIILKGDRHISDIEILETFPAYIKLKNIFKLNSEINICRTKLDKDTSHYIIDLIKDLSKKPLPKLTHSLDFVSRLIGNKISWENETFDFINPSTGFSFLNNKDLYKTHIPILNKIAALGLKSINFQAASFNDKEFGKIAHLIKAPNIDLSSNNLSLSHTLSGLKNCKTINLAGNNLTTANLDFVTTSLESLYLYKNRLKEVFIPSNILPNLKTLSLYRNNLTEAPTLPNNNFFERLNLGANPIVSIPKNLEDYKSLRFLGLAKTKITSIPDWVFSHPSLNTIDLSHIENNIPKKQLQKLLDSKIHIIKKPSITIMQNAWI